MDTFIIIAALALFIISSLGNSKKNQSSKKRLPPIKNPAPQSTSNHKKTYDYMLNKNSAPKTKKIPDIITEEKSTESSRVFTTKNTDAKTPMALSTSVSFNSSTLASPADTLTETISTAAKQQNLSIDIHRQAVLQAITYAEVLSPPKSLKYLTRFGIKRFPMK
ncbi:hypothetical protein [Pectinatus brassicae]|uniref:ABC-type antimicrobial peptide transport system permease subunit n=1 Tax=Pectinatus brassicae TaxID=862415 RepID=A0A840USV3_9FIRM|nr:hypothetical protein [Pectinatus brassicae]MBB5335585.1 ABC-type antimicrobial peptide transport system permease subunit [Pectinatus brassicae]